MREVSVAREIFDAVIDRFVFRLICEVTRDQLLDHRDHFGDVFRRGWKFVRAFDAQCFDILKKRLLEWRRKFFQWDTGLARAADRFVIHVRDIHHAMNLVTAQLEMSLQQIFEDVGAIISDVGETVNRRPAGVHSDQLVRRQRTKLFDFARVSIKKPKRHFCYFVMSSAVETSLTISSEREIPRLRFAPLGMT